MTIAPWFAAALITTAWISMIVMLVNYITRGYPDPEPEYKKLAIMALIFIVIFPSCFLENEKYKKETWVKENCKTTGEVLMSKDGPVEQYDCGGKQYKRE